MLVALGALGPTAALAQSEPAPSVDGQQREYIVLLLPTQETPTSRRLQAEISELAK